MRRWLKLFCCWIVGHEWYGTLLTVVGRDQYGENKVEHMAVLQCSRCQRFK